MTFGSEYEKNISLDEYYMDPLRRVEKSYGILT
jgi:hypothetical protein